jgi:hypothetical protein
LLLPEAKRKNMKQLNTDVATALGFKRGEKTNLLKLHSKNLESDSSSNLLFVKAVGDRIRDVCADEGISPTVAAFEIAEEFGIGERKIQRAWAQYNDKLT